MFQFNNFIYIFRREKYISAALWTPDILRGYSWNSQMFTYTSRRHFYICTIRARAGNFKPSKLLSNLCFEQIILFRIYSMAEASVPSSVKILTTVWEQSYASFLSSFGHIGRFENLRTTFQEPCVCRLPTIRFNNSCTAVLWSGRPSSIDN